MKKTLLTVSTVISLVCALHSQNVGIGTNTPASKLDVQGNLSLREGAALNLANGNNDNVTLTGNFSFYRITGPTAAFSINGIVPVSGADGQLVTLVNTTTQILTIKNEAASSAAANRFTVAGGSDLVSVAGGSSVTIQYNKTTSRWYVTASQNFIAPSNGVANISVTAPITTSGGANPTIGLGIVPVSNGGTGLTAIAPGQIAIGNGSNTYVNTTISSGTGINVVSGAGSITVNNTAPDQTVTLTGGGINSVSGSYPNFTITGTEADGSVTNEAQTLAGSGTSNINLTQAGGAGGGTITLQGSGATNVSRSGNTFTINSTDNNTTYSAGTGLNLSGTTFNLSNVGTAGTYTKVTTNAQGQVISGTTLTSGDLPSHTHTWSQVTSKPATWLDGSNLISQLSDFNTSSPSGFYQGYNATNAPGSSWYNMLNVRHSNAANDHGFQIAASYYDENIWARTYKGGTGNNDGTFTAWRQLLHTGNAATLYPNINGDNLGNHTATTTLNLNGNTLSNAVQINSNGDHLEMLRNRTDDNTYEWIGYYSGGTRQGIMLWDGGWTTANNLTNEFSITAENNNILTLNASNNHIALMPDGTGHNVGIGTVSPAEKLHVAGNVRVDGLNGTSTLLTYADANGTLVNAPAGFPGECYTHWGSWGCATGYFEVIRGNTGGQESFNNPGGYAAADLLCISDHATVLSTWSSGYYTRLMRADAQGDGMNHANSECSICCNGGCYTAFGINTCASGYTIAYTGNSGALEAYTSASGYRNETLCIDGTSSDRYTWGSGYNTRLMRHRPNDRDDQGMESVSTSCAVCCK